MRTPTNGNDRLVYGDGDDRGDYENVFTYIDLLGGNDVVNAGGGNDFFSGGDGKDRIYGEAGSDALYGGAGGDKLYGGAGDDFLNGGSEGEGTDEGKDDLYGGTGNDTIFGGGGKDRLYGDEGDDQIGGGLGDDRLWGGTGDDQLEGGDGKDILEGEDGDDILDGDAGSDRLSGGEGNDIISGDGYGGAGGNDTIDSGDGIDYAVFRGRFSEYSITTDGKGVTTVSHLAGSGHGSSDGKDRVTNTERLVFEDRTISLSAPDLDATFAGANVIAVGDFADGSFTAGASLDLPDDVDIWRVSLTAGQAVQAFTTSDVINQPRTNIAVYDAAGRFIDINWDDNQDDPDEGFPDLVLAFTAQETGDYYFAVAGYAHIPTREDDAGGPHYSGFSGQSGDYIFNLTG
jgi:hypothetical protein